MKHHSGLAIGIGVSESGFERRYATGPLGHGIPALKRPAYIRFDATRLQRPQSITKWCTSGDTNSAACIRSAPLSSPLDCNLNCIVTAQDDSPRRIAVFQQSPGGAALVD
jgi:hypothetical protein